MRVLEGGGGERPFSPAASYEERSVTHCMSGGEREGGRGTVGLTLLAGVDVVPLPPPPSRLAFGS